MKADFSKIINESIKITKTNKKLWVFGLVVAAMGAGVNFGSGGNFSDAAKGLNNHRQETNLDIDKLEVLGTSTNTLTETFKAIPVTFYFTLVILLVTVVVIGVGIKLYAKSWAQSGLIYGIDKDGLSEDLSLYQMSDYGKRNASEVIKLNVFPSLIFGLLVIVSILIIFSIAILLGDAGKVIAMFLGVLWAFVVIIASIFLAMSIKLGILAINIESLKWRAGLKRGFSIFKSYFFDVIIMSIINCFVGCIFGVVMLIGLALLAGVGFLSVLGVVAFPPLLILAGPVLFIALLALILLMGLIGTISAVFKQSTWVLLYKQLTEKPNGQ